jgi:hypothetical protein
MTRTTPAQWGIPWRIVSGYVNPQDEQAHHLGLSKSGNSPWDYLPASLLCYFLNYK